MISLMLLFSCDSSNLKSDAEVKKENGELIISEDLEYLASLNYGYTLNGEIILRIKIFQTDPISKTLLESEEKRIDREDSLISENKMVQIDEQKPIDLSTSKELKNFQIISNYIELDDLGDLNKSFFESDERSLFISPLNIVIYF